MLLAENHYEWLLKGSNKWILTDDMLGQDYGWSKVYEIVRRE